MKRMTSVMLLTSRFCWVVWQPHVQHGGAPKSHHAPCSAHDRSLSSPRCYGSSSLLGSTTKLRAHCRRDIVAREFRRCSATPPCFDQGTYPGNFNEFTL
eukprot:6206279-Pleurochrysis_carterae.AAC.7